MVGLDMEMPSRCIKCKYLSDNFERCLLTKKKLTNNIDVYTAHDCPLKPLPKCECGELKIQLHDAMCFYEAEKNHADELEDKLAVAEKALRKECDYGSAVSDTPLDKYIEHRLQDAAAELKAEKGERKWKKQITV